MFRISVAALAASLMLAATPAPAATYSKISMSELTSVLQNAGLAVRTTSNAGVIGVGGTFVLLTDCDSAGRCGEISMFRNYNDVRPTLQAVNTWNNTRKIPEASINSDGTLHMEFWVSAIGVTDTSIVDSFGWFERYAADVDFWGPYMAGT